MVVTVANCTSEMLLETFDGASSALESLFDRTLGCEFASILVHAWSVPITCLCWINCSFGDLMLVVVWHTRVMLVSSIFSKFTLLLALVDVIRVTCSRVCQQS